MAIVTLKNRWREPFVGMYDGKEYEIADTLLVPDYIGEHLKRQSIVRDNPVFPSANTYQLGIVEKGDDVSPILEKPVEAFDRSDTEHPKSKIVPSGIRQNAPAPREGSGANQVLTKER
jgi:hypothetical protein